MSRFQHPAARRIAVLVPLVALVAVLPGETSAAAEVKVEIGNFAFAPRTLTVAPGTTVTWVNEDEEAHTVAETGRIFRSKLLDTGGTFSYTFTAPGRFQYFCSLHPHMTATIIVAPNEAGS